MRICGIWQRPKVVQVCTAIRRIAGSLIHILCCMCHAYAEQYSAQHSSTFMCGKYQLFLGNDEYRAKLAQLRTSTPLCTTCHSPNIYQMPHMCSRFKSVTLICWVSSAPPYRSCLRYLWDHNIFIEPWTRPRSQGPGPDPR